MRADLRILVDDLVRDFAGRLEETARDRALDRAIVQYGRDMPRVIVSDCRAFAAVPGSSPAMLELPAEWDEASAAVSIEFPIGHQPRHLLLPGFWDLQATPSGPVLAMNAVDAGALYRLTWTAPHVVDPGSTIPGKHHEAVAQYAAGLLLDEVSTMTSGDSEATIKADQVDQAQKGPNYAERARNARKRYHDLIGIDPKRQVAASVTVNPPLPATTGWGRLLFRRRYRG